MTSSLPPANGFVAVARKVYNPIGFSKGYNFVLFFIFAGALMGFTLARFQYLDLDGIFCGSDEIGECYFMQHGSGRIGILLHLGAILPASFLVCFQFVPAIRHKFIIVHRINGTIILLLSLVSTAGAFIIARHSFGGEFESQLGIGVVGILFILSLLMGYVNIKRLQLEEHRAWMLRAWFYASSIITLRFTMIAAASIISGMDGYYSARMCGQIEYILGHNSTEEEVLDCSDADAEKYVLVPANLGGNGATAGSALGLSFGPAMWLAFTLHALGIEIYLRLTPAEHKRLRKVSYQRQLEAGMKLPGNAGLTADRFGDSGKWAPTVTEEGS